MNIPRSSNCCYRCFLDVICPILFSFPTRLSHVRSLAFFGRTRHIWLMRLCNLVCIWWQKRRYCSCYKQTVWRIMGKMVARKQEVSLLLSGNIDTGTYQLLPPHLASVQSIRWGLERFCLNREGHKVKICSIEQTTISLNHLGTMSLFKDRFKSDWHSTILIKKKQNLPYCNFAFKCIRS